MFHPFKQDLTLILLKMYKTSFSIKCLHSNSFTPFYAVSLALLIRNFLFIILSYDVISLILFKCHNDFSTFENIVNRIKKIKNHTLYTNINYI